MSNVVHGGSWQLNGCIFVRYSSADVLCSGRLNLAFSCALSWSAIAMYSLIVASVLWSVYLRITSEGMSRVRAVTTNV